MNSHPHFGVTITVVLHPPPVEALGAGAGTGVPERACAASKRASTFTALLKTPYVSCLHTAQVLLDLYLFRAQGSQK